jgi:hypothetical protein
MDTSMPDLLPLHCCCVPIKSRAPFWVKCHNVRFKILQVAVQGYIVFVREQTFRLM